GSHVAVGGVLCGDAKIGNVALGNGGGVGNMALGVHSDLIQTALFRGMCRVGVDGYISAVHLQVTVSIAGGNRGVDGALGGRQLTLDGGHHGGVIILLAANTGRDGLQLGDGGVHSTGIIRVILNPVGNLLKGVQAVLGIVGNQLCGQLLIGDGAGALAGVGANQGADAGHNRLESGIEVSLRHLRLVGQSSQTLDGDVDAVHGQGAVGCAGGDQDVHRLLGNGQCDAVDLDGLQDVSLRAHAFQSGDAGSEGIGLLLDLLGVGFQTTKGEQAVGVVRHGIFLLFCCLMGSLYDDGDQPSASLSAP